MFVYYCLWIHSSMEKSPVRNLGGLPAPVPLPRLAVVLGRPRDGPAGRPKLGRAVEQPSQPKQPACTAMHRQWER